MELQLKNTLPKQFSFAKDLSGRYLFACENIAEVTGFDSPAQMIGKRDSEMFWREWADHFREGDSQAFRGSVFLNQAEMYPDLEDPNKTRHTLATKTPLRNSQNEIIGVVASAIDVTEHNILKNAGQFDPIKNKFVFDRELSGLTFSKKQMVILEYIIKGYSAAEIGLLLNRSKRTIEGHIEHLKNKLQCSSKAELIRWAVTSGLSHSLEWSLK